MYDPKADVRRAGNGPAAEKIGPHNLCKLPI